MNFTCLWLKTRSYEDQFHNGRQENVPENLSGNDTRIAIYNLINEPFKEHLKRTEGGAQNTAAVMAEGIDQVIKSIVLENGKPIIHWVNKSDIEERINIEIDDYLYELKAQHIRVYPDGRVKVIAPFDTSEESLTAKLREKAPWIIKQQLEFLSYHPLTPSRKYINGETHLYLGRQYKLRIEQALINEVKLFRGKLLGNKKANSSTKNLLSV